MKVKYVMFFYNSDLLSKIIHKETQWFRSGDRDINTMQPGDLIKLTGEHMSCIVEFINARPKDINNNRDVAIKLIKELPGELEMEY